MTSTRRALRNTLCHYVLAYLVLATPAVAGTLTTTRTPSRTTVDRDAETKTRVLFDYASLEGDLYATGSLELLEDGAAGAGSAQFVNRYGELGEVRFDDGTSQHHLVEVRPGFYQLYSGTTPTDFGIELTWLAPGTATGTLIELVDGGVFMKDLGVIDLRPETDPTNTIAWLPFVALVVAVAALVTTNDNAQCIMQQSARTQQCNIDKDLCMQQGKKFSYIQTGTGCDFACVVTCL